MSMIGAGTLDGVGVATYPLIKTQTPAAFLLGQRSTAAGVAGGWRAQFTVPRGRAGASAALSGPRQAPQKSPATGGSKSVRVCCAMQAVYCAGYERGRHRPAGVPDGLRPAPRRRILPQGRRGRRQVDLQVKGNPREDGPTHHRQCLRRWSVLAGWMRRGEACC